MESYHKKLRKKGYLVEKVIEQKDLKLGLTQVLFDEARGLFNSLKIVPSEIALKGEKFKPEKESHLVYVLYNPSHIEVRKMIRECQQEGPVANMLGLEDSEGVDFPLNLGYQETILNLPISNLKPRKK